MSASPTPTASAKNWRGTGVVLVVDDEEDVRHTAARLIAHFGFQVHEADSGPAALAYFHAGGAADLVLLDQTMPDMDGLATLTELRKLMPALRVVLFSGFSEEDARHHFRGKSITRFLQKPFSLDMLRDTLRAAVGGTSERP